MCLKQYQKNTTAVFAFYSHLNHSAGDELIAAVLGGRERRRKKILGNAFLEAEKG